MDEKTIASEILETKDLEYYGVVHTYGSGEWYATSILAKTPTEALERFSHFTGVTDYRVVKIRIPIELKKAGE